MKTGILTFTHTSNYGAVFQAYAMQTLLNGLGIDNEFIDYFSPEVLKKHDPKMLKHRPGLANKLIAPFSYPVYAKRLKKFLDFEKENLKFSDRKYTRENISQSTEYYSRFLVGSDQVWNPKLTRGDMSFFLDFVEEKERKLSYAASLGASNFPEEYREQCYGLVEKFAFVNVREKTSEKILNAAGIGANAVLDPTLMLDKNQWMSFVGNRPYKKKYIFMYMPPRDTESVRKIRSYAKKHGYAVFAVKKGIKPTPGFKTLNTLSPSEFLTWLYHSEIVVSGSFHGVCISIIFEKPFWAFSAYEEKLTARTNDLLAELDLMSRKYRADTDFSSENIDFSSVKLRLKELREISDVILKKTFMID